MWGYLQGFVLKQIKTQKEVKRGMNFSPPTFNIIYAVVRCLNNLKLTPPKLGDCSIGLLFYSDDIVVLPTIPRDFKRALRILVQDHSNDNMEIKKKPRLIKVESKVCLASI